VLQACQESLEQGGRPISIKKTAAPPYKPEIQAHETAVIDAGCEVGEGTKIWHFSHVIKGSKIGRHCNVGQNVVIGPDVTIGDKVKIQNNVSVFQGVTLEDGVFCGPSMVFTNVYNPRSYISRKNEIRSTLVREGATLGANCTVLCGHTIGRFAFIGAGTVVLHDVPDFALMVGNPAGIKGWMCRCGVRLHFDGSRATCDVCGSKYVKEGDSIQEA
jgi:UDP-2-acetamido-3-amino-2,3-dideoxy-glucuronate N-acetyltransferase